MDGFEQRLDLLRLTFTKTPGLSLKLLAEQAQISETLLEPNYRGPRTSERRDRIASAASALLPGDYFDEDAVVAWLVQGEEVFGLAEYLQHLAAQVACTICGGWFVQGDGEYIAPLRRCRPCVRAVQRVRSNPEVERYEKRLQESLPKIRAVLPRLGSAVEETLRRRESVTFARLARLMEMPVREVARIMGDLGLNKRGLVGFVAAAIAISTLFSVPVARAQRGFWESRRRNPSSRRKLFARRSRRPSTAPQRTSPRPFLLPGVRPETPAQVSL